jgi:hypothetical protein
MNWRIRNIPVLFVWKRNSLLREWDVGIKDIL